MISLGALHSRSQEYGKQGSAGLQARHVYEPKSHPDMAFLKKRIPDAESPSFGKFVVSGIFGNQFSPESFDRSSAKSTARITGEKSKGNLDTISEKI